MDMFKSAFAEYQKHASAAADNDDDKEVMQNSLHTVKQEGVAPPQESDLHEAKAVHEKVYQQGLKHEASDEELGKAAGVEAFHEYEKSEATKEGEGGGQGQLIQMAMAEAMKMFSGGGGSDKSTVIKSAVAMAMQLFMGKSGAGGGGVGQLMAMFSGGGKKEGEESSGGMAGIMAQASSNPQVASLFKKFM
ncbi:hypothetical protein BGZ99_001546 [Dissophora globulifera]|uniref:DUF7721 domain-containing protein n=1 Tax=Dissophora globulifera TaxID=979702 RepID=A0A9P6RWI1_9FUNG|nr:hypothetical protein BGZ99_001546 [Dissophora globulifera]